MGAKQSKPQQGHDFLFDQLPEETKQQLFEHCEKWYKDNYDLLTNSLPIGWKETYTVDGIKYDVSPVQRWRRWFDKTQDSRSYVIAWREKNGVGSWVFQFVVYPPYLLFVRSTADGPQGAPTAPRDRSLGSYSEPHAIPGESVESCNPCTPP